MSRGSSRIIGNQASTATQWDLRRFERWLEAHGYTHQPKTNPWELMRMCGEGGTLVVYRNKHGALRVTGLSMRLHKKWGEESDE